MHVADDYIIFTSTSSCVIRAAYSNGTIARLVGSSGNCAIKPVNNTLPSASIPPPTGVTYGPLLKDRVFFITSIGAMQRAVFDENPRVFMATGTDTLGFTADGPISTTGVLLGAAAEARSSAG